MRSNRTPDRRQDTRPVTVIQLRSIRQRLWRQLRDIERERDDILVRGEMLISEILIIGAAIDEIEAAS
jgi:hypothetical protein